MIHCVGWNICFTRISAINDGHNHQVFCVLLKKKKKKDFLTLTFIKEPIKTFKCHQFIVLFVRFLSVSRKLLNVKIIDDEEYEKNKTFMIVLEEPVLLEVGQRHGESSVMSSSVFNDGREG